MFKSHHSVCKTSTAMQQTQTRKEKLDIEAQHQHVLNVGEKAKGSGSPLLSPRIDSEYIVPATTKFAYLSVYFLCNVGLTIYNKAVLGHFAYPWFLTALHTGSASIGCYVLLLRGDFSLSKLSSREHVTLVLFSFLFTINIAISNVSLAMVSMPFHQIMRSTTPIFTILIYRVRFKRSYSMKVYLSLIPIVLGVGLATYGDYYFTTIGFILTLLGVILAAVKVYLPTVITNRIMTGPLALSPLEILFRMSPLAFIQALAYSHISGELSSFSDCLTSSAIRLSSLPNINTTNPSSYFTTLPLPSSQLLLALLGNGLLAFVLNISSFSTNKNTGALTMTVCGNVKQCLTILLGIMVFGVEVSLLNGVGMAVTLVGAAWYSFVELGGRGKR
ncbi:related to glucose-6-phosphate/phosphate translocator [Phialocephala subalpina]|uniref:Related to glucose-6-phosphate/phosphate translocator n=1 Tax=Phialocephala subalpina TaxID=576137 RepID=A0A1L7WP39_9HELO|nr:related to glucose-6-phosphate/phosphate translocator [Phialocephala subalpina]